MPPLDFSDPDFLSAAMGSLIEAAHAETLGGQGHMSDVYRVHLEGPAVPATVIIKCESADPARRELAERYTSYKKESAFYRLRDEVTGVNLPACFYNSEDKETFLLILEDLGDDTGFSRASGADETQVFAASEAMAAIHGHGLSAPSLKEGFLQASEDFQTFVGEYLESLEPDPAVELLCHYARHSMDFLDSFLALPQVFCHMDFRDDNLRWQNGTLTVLDWGEHCLAPAGFDLAMFMVSSVDSANRRTLETAFLGNYAALARIDQQAAFDSYRLALPHMVYLPALTWHQGHQRDADRLIRRLLPAVNDHLAFLNQAFT